MHLPNISFSIRFIPTNQLPAKLKFVAGLLLVLCLKWPVSAQQELMLHSMSDLWHSSSINPAFFPENKFLAIGLPGIGLDASHSGDISYNDIFVKSGDRRVIDFSNALSKLQPTNTVHFDQRIETVSLGFRLPGKIWLQVGHGNRFGGTIRYPKTLPALIWDGNAQYIGQTVDVALQTNVSDWNEWNVGLAKDFGKLKLGLRAKYLTGVSALLTDEAHNKATVTTSNDIYQLTLATDFGFHASSILNSIDTSGLAYDFVLGELRGKAFSKNTGFAVDLGAQYKVNERITLDFSLLDIGGKIHWKESASYFISQGEYEYEGAVLPGADIISGSDSLDFSTKLDTLNDIFNFQKSAQKFETTLPLQAYAGGTYQLTKRWTLGLGAYFRKEQDEKARMAVGASARWKALKWLSLGAMYCANDRSAANVGFHVAFTPGPIQLYFASDNLLDAFSVKSNPVVNLRTGLSLVF